MIATGSFFVYKNLSALAKYKRKYGDCLKNYVYVELEDSVQVTERNVRISDIATVWTAEPALAAKIKNMVVYRFETSPGGRNADSQSGGKSAFQSGGKSAAQSTAKPGKQVISLLWLTGTVLSHIPDAVVIPHGESDCIVELVPAEKKDGKTSWLQKCKVCLISLICLFGGAFSIMAFHNDISITNIFMQFYEFVTGNESSGFTVLEVSYSIGLLVGILVFYNHVGKKKISPEPTPIEVSMRSYERDMDEAIVTRYEREGKKIDVG